MKGEVLLDVLICSYDRRVMAIDLCGLPKVEGVRYLISWQNPNKLPRADVDEKFASREDIEVVESATQGLCKNRNISLDKAIGRYILIGDDDLTYDREGIKELIATFEANKAVDFLTMRSNGPYNRVFPPNGHDLAKSWRFYYPISFEMAMRLETVRKKKWRFSELTGVGAPFLECGEEDLFLYHAIRSGAVCRFYDFVIATHKGFTTSEHSAARRGVLRTKGACLRIIRGNLISLLCFPIEAWRSRANFFKAMWCYLEGYVYSVKHRKEL